MSDLFRLRNQLKSAPFSGGFGDPSLFKKLPLPCEHIRYLRDCLQAAIARSEKPDYFLSGVLVCVCYKNVVSKSRRFKVFFRGSGSSSDSFIVGARIDEDDDVMKHVITYYVPRRVAQHTVECADCLLSCFSDRAEITNEMLLAISKLKSPSYEGTGLRSSYVTSFLIDCSNVESMYVPEPKAAPAQTRLVTIFKAGMTFGQLMAKLQIDVSLYDPWDDYSAAMTPLSYDTLVKEAGYLIAMSQPCDSDVVKTQIVNDGDATDRVIPSPNNEPTIGVIDTSFDDGVYFSEWVSVDNSYLKEMPTKMEDRVHATEVCSILVDGPALNPSLDDHCGRFKVRLFPVAAAGRNSWINIASRTRKIVMNNRDIRVWNLSLGSEFETEKNYVSPMAALLDELQAQFPDILFIIAGTNVPRSMFGSQMRVGAPADSINSLVVNAVGDQGEIPPYARKGPVLSFFRKPDVSYYGGVDPFGIRVMVTKTHCDRRTGTSLAAPWIARKAAFMMNVMGFTREETKALIINSALSFDRPPHDYPYLGYGVVPITIEEVVEPKRDEIRFVIKDVSKNYVMYTYDLPMPMVNNAFPFKARIVLAATLSCDRNKGVDYTNEELGVAFGRMAKGKIKTINGDVQDEAGTFTDEESARALFRKWDNVKVVTELLKTKRLPVKAYDDAGLWGIRVTSKLRNDSQALGRDSRFALVVTMKEIYGQDRSYDFERRCLARGWIVERINVQNKLHVYNVAMSDIEWK